MKQISPHITWSEATKSAIAVRLGLPNEPAREAIEKMQKTAAAIFEPLRAHFGVPISVTSFFRSKAVNKATGGARNSQHMTGEAMDLDADVFGGMRNSELFTFILHNLPFDQLIWEHGNQEEPAWVHVSFSPRNRREVLRATRKGGRVSYEQY